MRPSPNLTAAQIINATETPQAQFTFSSGFWDGGRRSASGLTGDATPVDAFISSHYQNDAKTLNPARSDPISSSIFDMNGFIKITSSDLNVTFALGSDDGSLLLIGQTPVEV